MAYVIEVNKRDVSPYAEECPYAGEDGHECDGQCRWLDGDLREIQDHGTTEYAYDEDDAEEHGTPVQWAIAFLSGHRFPALEPSTTGPVGEHAWLSGHEEHSHKEQRTEYSVYLRGGWTLQERAAVFEAVGG